MAKASVIIAGRAEKYFLRTVECVLQSATGDIEVIAVIDGDEVAPRVELSDKRVKVLRLKKSIGQRAAYNLGVRHSTGKYVMKLDAHAILSRGFDEVLQSHCPDNAIVLPEMRRLDVHKWKSKPRGKTHFMFFGLDLYCHYWKDYRKRPEARCEYPEVLTGQGSCWFCTREWNDHIGLLDEKVGSWGNVGIEVSLRTWLCGGSQIVNKQAWQAHWFRVSEGGFPYPMSGRRVARAHKYTWENYYFKDDAFEHQTRPFSWLLHKFAPVPGWEVYIADEYRPPRVIVYYTDSRLEQSLARAVRSNLKKVAGPIPIISVSQKPLDFGTNICVGEKESIDQYSMYEQLLAGLDAAPKGSIVYLCEHDVFYHPSHFVKLPKSKKHAYFNKNRYYWTSGGDRFYKAAGLRALSQGVAYREMWIRHVRKRLADWKENGPSRLAIRFFNFNSFRPNIDVRHYDNLTSDSRTDRLLRKQQKKGSGIKNLGGWGSPGHFQSTTSYKGMMRGDIVQFLINRHGYKSYLEIGVRGGDTFKHITCKYKVGVDPAGRPTHKMTSDEFFSKNKRTYDIIFIDGLHEDGQVRKDIANSLECLNPGGVIVMHDCSPRNEKEQTVPKLPGQRIWTGDVWKAFIYFRRRADLSMYVVDTNNGVGIVRRGEQVPLVVDSPTYLQLSENRVEWLGLVDTIEFKRRESQPVKMPMKIRKYEPVDEHLMQKAGDDGTICQTIREIYNATEDEAIRLKCRTAMAMAKSLVARLKTYKQAQDALLNA